MAQPKEHRMFGDTVELQGEKLLSLIQNAVSYGEWELAQASSKLYYQTTTTNRNELQVLLQGIIQHPRKYSHGSKTIPTPFHLCWLALIHYMELFSGGQEEVLLSSATKRLIEFKMFLLTLSKELTPEQQQDSYCFFKLGLKKHEQHEALIGLSNEFCSFLSDFAVANPQSCRAMTEFLVNPMNEDKVIEQRKSKVGDCYLRVLLSYIGRLQLFEESVRSMFLGECFPVIVSAKKYFNSDSIVFSNAISSVVKIILEHNPGAMNMLYCTLIDEESLPFLMVPLELSWKHKLSTLNLQDMLEEKICGEREHNWRVAEVLSKGFAREDGASMMTMFQICDYYKLHFLDSILDASLEMVKEHQYSNALELLKPTPLLYLRPLVVLLAWPCCSSSREKKALLAALLTVNDVEFEPTFHVACKRLQYNLRISENCFQKLEGTMVTEDSDEIGSANAEIDLFHDMDFYSVLHILNKLNLINLFHFEEVIDILQHQPPCVTLEEPSDNGRHKQSEIRTYICFCILQSVINCFIGKGDKASGSVNDVKLLIRRVRPLIYRLEILEDLFSLLFVRDEHLSAVKTGVKVNRVAMEGTCGSVGCEEQSNVPGRCDAKQGKGFQFEQDAVKTYLDLLYGLIDELIAEKYSEKEEKSQSTEDKSSFAPSTFDKRILQLRQNVNRAIWRLQLVYGFDSAEDSSDWLVEPAKDSIEEHVCDGSSISCKYSDVQEGNDKLLSQMLSSPESLAHLCLQKGSLLQAQQVIKVFQLEDCFCGVEVNFAEVLEGCIESLKATQPPEVSSESSNLTNIKSAAAAGLLSSKVRALMNNLLQHKCIDSNHTSFDHALEEMRCFAAIAVCFDLVTSAELHSVVCKIILDIAEEFIKLVDESCSELKALLMNHLSALKSSVHLYGQLDSGALKNELNDQTKSFSHFVTKPYRKCHGEGTALTLNKLSEQKTSLEEIVSFIDEGTNGDGALSEDKKSDSTPCRRCINETLEAYSSDSLLLIPEDRARRNYIKTLFRHMDTLARLQLYFKTKHTGGVQATSKSEQKSSLSGVKAVNPFVVLKDDISVIFGRLLFEYSMPPKRLESIAKQVNINLVKVVAKSFDLSIPVDMVQKCPDLATFLLTQPRKVLNDGESEATMKHPLNVIEELVTTLLGIIEDLPSLCDSHVGSDLIQQLVTSTEFSEFQLKTTVLKFVDLQLLVNDEEKLCFLVNLYNLMFTHGLLLILGGALERISALSAVETSKWTYELLMHRPVGRFAIDQFLAYKVGQLGVVSAFDLCHHILLGGVPSTYYGDAFKARHDLYEWTQDRLAYSPSKHERSCIFVLTHSSASCPRFKLLKAEGFKTHLELAKKRYLEQDVKIIPKEKKVIFPRLLHWHRDLFLPRQPLTSGLQTASSLDFKDRNFLLLEFIRQSSSKFSDQLEKMNTDSILFDVGEFNWKLCFAKGLPKPIAESVKIGRRYPALSRIVNYSLSEPMKKYLYDASPVSASVICMAVEKKKFLNQISEMIIESKYGGIKMGKQRISSLQTFIEDGIKNLSQSVEANAPFKAFTGLCCETILKILKSLQVDHPSAAGKYVENAQSLIKVTVSMLDVCGSINMESSEFLEELFNVLLHHGGILISAFIETFPHVCPVKNRDMFLCESIHTIHDRLDDLMETCVNAGEDALNIDLDHVTKLNSELKRCLLLVSDPFLRCKMTLSSIAFYNADEAIELVEVCAEGCVSSEELLQKLKLEAEKITWYDDLRKLFLDRFPDHQASQRVKLTKWQDFVDFVEYHPEDITILLVASGSFDQVDFWINNFSVPHHLSKICLRAKLYDVLKDECLEYNKLHHVLDQLDNKHVTFELCDDMLQSSEISTRHSLLLLRYMIENLAETVSTDRVLQLKNSELGFKAVDQFPESLKSSYWHLTSKPELILEQLLMNMKVELAKNVIDVYKDSIVEDGPLSYLLSKIDEVIAVYAEKSLDVPVVETIIRKSSKIGTLAIDKRRSAKKHKRNGSHQSPSVGIENDIVKQEDHSANSSFALDDKSNYKVPSKPVDSKFWVPDHSVATCQVCKVQMFSTFNRRHHCRNCGRLSCANCSSYRWAVPGYSGKVRVCKDCFDNFYTGNSRTHNEKTEQLTVQDGPSHGEVLSSLPRGNTPGTNTDTELETGRKTEVGEFRGWQLTTDATTNQEIRRHFCYDQAPSASLCISIIEQCSDARKIGGLLLKFCNKLSEYLNERDSSKYHDIDNTLLVRMIEFLNFNAKVKFMKAGFINGVELCDFEMAHVEVLRVLLNSDWKEIPTMQELAHPEVIRRLRDKIIESERFALAIDVTGKCGLDPGAVWFAWGLSQLKSGDLKDARDNFSKCLTPLKSVEDKALQQNVLYLTQIVEIIEASPLLAYIDVDLLSPLYALQDLGRGSAKGCPLDGRRYDEIMYYLNKYGSHSQIVQFYVRQGLFRKAADYIKAQQCSPEIFFEDLLLRSFQIGSFELLSREMEEIDPTLNKWKEYLVKSCQYLSKKGLFNCLYQMQIFLKDYFRAATTRVRFFLGESGSAAMSFKDLHKRIHHLETAKKHLETLLKDKAIVKSTFVSHIGSQRVGETMSAPLVQDVSVAELKSHMNTIDLQVKVLNFLNGRPDIFEDATGKVPTLFGNGKERSDLVSKLLIASMSNSFPLVSRIIQDYRLPALAVFGDCIQRLIQRKDYDQIFSLIKTIEGTGMMPDKGRDNLLLKVIRKIISVGESARQANAFVKMIRSQAVKVDALIVCGRLKDAYVEATKENQVQNVERILQEAERLNQKYVVDICQRYLKNFEERQERKEKRR